MSAKPKSSASSPRNGTAARGERTNQAGRQPAKKSCNSSSSSPKRIPPGGYDRIQGALANLGHQISDTTVGSILRDHDIEPAPHTKNQNHLEDLPQGPLAHALGPRLH